MDPILTRCGYRCDLCLAYRPNVEANPANAKKLSDGWYEYFGFRIPAEAIRCDGCMSADPVLIDKACPVRPCVLEKQLANCAGCSDYENCEKLTDRLVIFEQVQEKYGKAIPKEQRRSFILPYENKIRLDQQRKR